MPDVRLPNGTIVKNVPEGMTQAELKATLIEKGAATEEDFAVAAPVRPEKPKVNTEAIENLEKQAEVDPVGAFNALASGRVVDGIHYKRLSGGQSFTFNVKCKEIYISNPATGTEPLSYTVVAGLTNIPVGRMYELTGSGLTD